MPTQRSRAQRRPGRRGAAGGHADGQPDRQEPAGTGRNLAATRAIRLGLGHTRDVSMIDGEVEVLEIDALPQERGDRFVAHTGFDPRELATRPAGSASPRNASRPGARWTSCPAAS